MHEYAKILLGCTQYLIIALEEVFGMNNSEFKVECTKTVFYVRLPDKSKAYLRYKVENGIMYLIETYTPPAFRGRGVAKLMIEKAIEYAIKENLKIVPQCSYAIKYFIKYEEKRVLLSEEYKKMSLDDLEKYYQQRLENERQKLLYAEN
ncbi:MAG: GNAT family N-acetyltransferase [Nitrososphaeria archaeon]